MNDACETIARIANSGGKLTLPFRARSRQRNLNLLPRDRSIGDAIPRKGDSNRREAKERNSKRSRVSLEKEEQETEGETRATRS